MERVVQRNAVSLGVDATFHALTDGLVISSNLSKLYTPFARGIQNSGFTIISEEFAKCSTQAQAFATCLSLKSWGGVQTWLEVLHELRKNGPLNRIRDWEQLDLMMRRMNQLDYRSWEIPLIENSNDLKITARGINVQEYLLARSSQTITPYQWFALVVQIALFSLPISNDSLQCLELSKIAGEYVRARLFQGLYDQSKLMFDDTLSTIFLDFKTQRKPAQLEKLSTATSIVELENMLHNTTVVGNDSVILFALTRSQVHPLFGKTSTQEYLHYVRLCEQLGVVPVGLKYYQEIVHPVLNHPTYNSIVQYSF